MQIRKRRLDEKGKGEELGQWLMGAAGAMLTTLPAFFIFPLWLSFVMNYVVTDDNGREDDLSCFLICFLAGVLMWVMLIVAFSI